jgi:hypothetical protein
MLFFEPSVSPISSALNLATLQEHAGLLFGALAYVAGFFDPTLFRMSWSLM